VAAVHGIETARIVARPDAEAKAETILGQSIRQLRAASWRVNLRGFAPQPASIHAQPESSSGL
jgi:hypothetical protein